MGSRGDRRETTHAAIASDDDSGRRIDEWLAGNFDDISRSGAVRLIKSGSVNVNGEPPKPSTRLAAGDEIQVWKTEKPDETPTPQDIQFEIVYEDFGIIAVNKPPHLPVHPGAGRPDGTLVNGLLARYPEIASVGGACRPGIVHRLDMDTSGILLVARTEREHASLVSQFASRAVVKTYLALVDGRVIHESGVIEAPVGRKSSDRRRMEVNWSGKNAVTNFEIVARTRTASLLKLGLTTGRTHQARVHLEAIGHPVIGDKGYGGRHVLESTGSPDPPPERHMLHAWRISVHRSDGCRVECWAGLPRDFQRAAAQVGVDDAELAAFSGTGYNVET